jgi:NAD(P)-dependent dehydrogenase (short-subunit alcohol dehydrogenase family)
MIDDFLKNKNILITGAGKGIGEQLVYDCLEGGAFVYCLIKSKGDNSKFKNLTNIKIFNGDVNNTKVFKSIFNYSLKNKKLINGLVNNAGIRQRKKFVDISKTDLKKIFDTNFFAIFNLLQSYFKYVQQNKVNSSIVNIGSIVGKLGFNDLSGYASTKSALEGLTKSLALDFAEFGSRINIIQPGFTKTSFYQKFKKNKKLYNWTLNRTPLKRWGEPAEISNLIIFLLSDYSKYITGESISVDGGWSNA